MGCVQTKPSTCSPREGVHKLKLQNGYVKGGPDGRVSGRVKREVESKRSNDGNAQGRNGGLKRIVVVKKIGEDELVDGWPKWLVDNIDKDALSDLVQKSADSYDKLAKVGHGTYSNVYKARDRDTRKIVALKKVRFDASKPESVKFMAREIMILRQLNHPNIIKLEGIATSRMQYSLYLVFDFMQTDLTRIICRPGDRMTEPQIKCYMEQFLQGLKHCHEKGILHRDIKASNLLIDKDGRLKIADFGLANFFGSKGKRPLTSRVVTLWYRSPELLLGSTDYGVGVDLWSAGCLLAEMFLGRPFMPGKTEVEQLHRIFKLCGSPSEDYWTKMKVPATFRPPQHYQPSYREIFKNFPPSAFGLLAKLLALDPEYRGTAALALKNDFFSSSPLSCGLAGLPILPKEDPLPSHSKSKRKSCRHRTSKVNEVSQTDNERHGKKAMVVVQSKLKSDSFKEGKNTDSSCHSQETNYSASSNSIILRRNSHGAYLSPLRPSNIMPTLRTEAHPNASCNIQNYTLLKASISDIINPNEGNGVPHYRRSLSNLDFRYLDPEVTNKLCAVEKD